MTELRKKEPPQHRERRDRLGETLPARVWGMQDGCRSGKVSMSRKKTANHLQRVPGQVGTTFYPQTRHPAANSFGGNRMNIMCGQRLPKPSPHSPMRLRSQTL